jgi:integrase
MSNIRLRYIRGWVDKKTGKAYWRFRRRGYKEVTLPGLPGSREFMAAYQQALDQAQVPIGAKRTKAGSVSAAIVGYYDSTMFFGSLAPSTQAIRRQILERFRADHGDKPIALLPQRFIVLMLGKLKPSVAIGWLSAIRHLMQYAVSANLCEIDPTQGIRLKTPKSDGIYTWSEQDIAAYEAGHGVGTKARLALALGLYTAQRRNDVLRMGRQHIHDGILSVKQQKTGAALRIPVHPDLRAIIDATPGGHLTFLTTRTGKPYAGDNFSEQFRAWCKAARLPEKCSFHGLRKAACRRLAEAGCSVNEIAAISGHATLREVQRYTKAVDQERMARNAMARQVNDIATTGVKSG